MNNSLKPTKESIDRLKFYSTVINTEYGAKLIFETFLKELDNTSARKSVFKFLGLDEERFDVLKNHILNESMRIELLIDALSDRNKDSFINILSNLVVSHIRVMEEIRLVDDETLEKCRGLALDMIKRGVN